MRNLFIFRFQTSRLLKSHKAMAETPCNAIQLQRENLVAQGARGSDKFDFIFWLWPDIAYNVSRLCVWRHRFKIPGPTVLTKHPPRQQNPHSPRLDLPTSTIRQLCVDFSQNFKELMAFLSSILINMLKRTCKFFQKFVSKHNAIYKEKFSLVHMKGKKNPTTALKILFQFHNFLGSILILLQHSILNYF